MKKLSLFERTPRVSYNRDNSFLSDFLCDFIERVLSLLYHTPPLLDNTVQEFIVHIFQKDAD